jgi:glycerol kinase
MASRRYVLALDQGTTSSRAILYDADGVAVGVLQEEFRQYYPRPGWVEHDAVEIWETQRRVMDGVLAESGVGAGEVAAIGITNQRETVVIWDRKTGAPIHRAIVWQCRRTAEACEALRVAGVEGLIRERTGLILDPYFSGTKIAWVLDHVAGARERAERGELCAGTIDSWLVWNLTGGRCHVTDVSNGSRTMLMDTDSLAWDEELLGLLRVPRALLPELVSSSGVVGEADLGGVSVPIAGIAGDQQAALFGQGCWKAGMGKNTYGTGCFLLMHTGSERVAPAKGILGTVGWRIGDEVAYALEGSVFMGGAVIQWLRDELGLLTTAAESEQVAAQVADSGGVHVVPAFAGLGAPHWCAEARGMITGLTRGSGRPQIVRAALESIALQSMDVIDAMVAGGNDLQMIRVDGGASRNDLLMQFQADVLGVAIERPADVETTARGAALLAGLGCGLWPDRQELPVNTGKVTQFVPEKDEHWRRHQRASWQRAVESALVWGRSCKENDDCGE